MKALIEAPDVAGRHPSTLIVKLVKAAYYLFPNLSIFDIKTQAAHALPLSSAYVVWAIVYGLFYTALVVSGAALIFRRRELP